MKLLKIASLLTLTAASLASAADAALVFVGSWRVDQGPSWLDSPQSYTGQQAAALLFGGAAGDYAISTIGANPGTVDHQAWVSVWLAASFPDCAGFPCGRKVAEDAVTSSGGFYLNPGDESAFVNDWAIGADYTNYAFIDAVPEPASWAMLIAGFGLTGAIMRRRRGPAVAALTP